MRTRVGDAIAETRGIHRVRLRCASAAELQLARQLLGRHRGGDLVDLILDEDDEGRR